MFQLQGSTVRIPCGVVSQVCTTFLFSRRLFHCAWMLPLRAPLHFKKNNSLMCLFYEKLIQIPTMLQALDIQMLTLELVFQMKTVQNCYLGLWRKFACFIPFVLLHSQEKTVGKWLSSIVVCRRAPNRVFSHSVFSLWGPAPFHKWLMYLFQYVFVFCRLTFGNKWLYAVCGLSMCLFWSLCHVTIIATPGGPFLFHV